jgi:carbon-monoxide dehydrogenase medium subunit
VREQPDRVELGALTCVADLIDHPVFSRCFPCGSKAASTFASPQIRNRATIGGNFGNASPAADMAPPLIALGATVRLVSKKGSRSLPLEELFTGPGRTCAGADELIAGFEIPRRPKAFQYHAKFGSRGANVISVVSAAMVLELEAGKIREARVAYGCCAPVPLRARKVEAFLNGQQLDEKLIAGAAEAVLGEVRPIDDVRGSRRYKQMLAVNATQDALRQALGTARKAA